MLRPGRCGRWTARAAPTSSPACGLGASVEHAQGSPRRNHPDTTAILNFGLKIEILPY